MLLPGTARVIAQPPGDRNRRCRSRPPAPPGAARTKWILLPRWRRSSKMGSSGPHRREGAGRDPDARAPVGNRRGRRRLAGDWRRLMSTPHFPDLPELPTESANADVLAVLEAHSRILDAHGETLKALIKALQALTVRRQLLWPVGVNHFGRLRGSEMRIRDSAKRGRQAPGGGPGEGTVGRWRVQGAARRADPASRCLHGHAARSSPQASAGVRPPSAGCGRTSL